tara:strand:- start:2426 stop:2605 length:180 start_codon:yes stop_codon:yes gene_type:complete
MNLFNSHGVQALISTHLPRLCGSVPELVNVLRGLVIEMRELRETLERIEKSIEKTPNEQ